MVASFSWIEFLGAVGTTATPTNLNLGSTIAANLAPSTYPITAGTYSYEKWVKALFDGSFTRIENVQFWKSAGALVTGEVLNWTGQKVAYATPTNVVSTFATAAIGTSAPGSANVSIGGSLSGSLTATGYTDFIVLQSSITTAASAGATNSKTLVMQYDEV